jgi:hypothetical protein
MKKHILILSALILSFAQPVFAAETGQESLAQIGTGASQCSNPDKSSSSASADVGSPVVRTAGSAF